jgi:hypothetical protein
MFSKFSFLVVLALFLLSIKRSVYFRLLFFPHGICFVSIPIAYLKIYSLPSLFKTRHPAPRNCFIPVSDPCLNQPEISRDSLHFAVKALQSVDPDAVKALQRVDPDAVKALQRMDSGGL